jgi:putative ABC transport system substrate-binding protein
LREFGYVENRNIVYEWRYADGMYDRVPALTRELVAAKVDLIVTVNTPGAKAAYDATKEIPIVVVVAADYVKSGLAQSLAHPGGNVTGLSSLGEELYAKRFEILATTMPSIADIGFLINPDVSFYLKIIPEMQKTVARMGKRLVVFKATNADQISSAFASMASKKMRAVAIASDSFFNSRNAQIAELALKHKMISIHPQVEYVAAGGLLGYGPNMEDQFRRAANYVDKILRGAKPGELPIEQPSKFDFAINMKTAKALGIKIPNSVLVLATKVIE